jgi:glycosyltransferase involved in cell wall biosynthesis
MTPLVSIITPSYNQGRYIEETILSVLNQDYENIEYIIIDGGSTDDSLDIVKKYSYKLAYWVSEPDKGQADAINKGFLKAKGEFVCWLNSDDFIYKNFISSRVRQFQCNPDFDMIYGDVDQGREPGKVWLRKGRVTSYNKMRKTLEVPIPQQSAVWRRNVLQKTGMLNPEWHVLLDRDYFIRISMNHRIQYIPGAVAFFRIHNYSKSIKDSVKWAEELPLYYKSLIEKQEDYKNRAHSVMARCYWYCSKIYEENCDTTNAQTFMIKAIKESRGTIMKLLLIQFMVRVKHKMMRKDLFSE